MIISQQKENRHEIVQSACLPITCGYEDLYHILSFVSFLQPEDKPILQRTELTDFRVLYGHYKFYSDKNFTLIV